MGLYTEILTTVDISCQSFIQDNVTAISEGIKDPAFTLLGVYILFWGFSHMMNLVQEPMTDALKRLVKIVFILGIAFNLSTYNSYVVDTITKGPEELASLFAGSSGNTLAESLDKILSETWEVGSKFWSNAGVFDGNFGFYFVAIIIYGIACGLSAYSAFLIILSKVAVSVLVAIGPLFIISTLFKSTQKFFENWLGMLCNYGLIIVLVVGMNKFILDIFNTYLSKAVADNQILISSAASVVVTAIISFFVLGQILNLAGALGGGIALSTMGAGRWAGQHLGAAGKTTSKASGTLATAGATQLGQKLRPRNRVASYAKS